jgi:bis(5'-nucleosyl)-tetraphosphatase (symmetrical)
MYGSQPNDWSEGLTGYDRIRFIINACTRMRYLQHQHTLDFGCKTAPKDAPKNLAPWYQVSNSLLKKDHRVLFGHWAALHGKTNSKHFIGLDTGYIWGQSMTLINIDTMTKTSVKYQEK